VAVRSGDDRQVRHRLLQRLALARRAIIGICFPPIPWPMTGRYINIKHPIVANFCHSHKQLEVICFLQNKYSGCTDGGTPTVIAVCYTFIMLFIVQCWKIEIDKLFQYHKMSIGTTVFAIGVARSSITTLQLKKSGKSKYYLVLFHHTGIFIRCLSSHQLFSLRSCNPALKALSCRLVEI